ncbi:MAG: hypothetical protein AAGC77_06500 [Pseudomonadota bacterium]
MSLDKEFYAARQKADKDPDAFAKIRRDCLAAGYVVTDDNDLIATGAVKGAPQIDEKEAAKKFRGDDKGINFKKGASA